MITRLEVAKMQTMLKKQTKDQVDQLIRIINENIKMQCYVGSRQYIYDMHLYDPEVITLVKKKLKKNGFKIKVRNNSEIKIIW